MSVARPPSVVYAIDARTGELRWRHDPQVPRAWGLNACCDVVNRGVAAWGERLFVGTIDGRLVALDRATGEVVWETLTIDPERPYTITGAPRVVKGKAIEIHPLVTGGYNADFDGDAMSVYLPVTSKAVKEAATMYPSNNLFNPTTGAVMYTPGHEALLGMYLLSSPGKRTKNRYSTAAEAKAA